MQTGPYFPSEEFPNLDSLTEKELASVRADLEHIVAYCSHQIRAKQFRLEGKIQSAIDQEKGAEIIYDQFPEWATW